MNHFELFDIPVSFFPDTAVVSKKYLMLQKKFHPDFFANASPDEQAEALAQSSMANKALLVLKDSALLIPYILEMNEVLSVNENYQLPPSFLMEVMDLNEQVMEVSDDTQKAALRVQLKQLEDEIFEPIKGLLESYQVGITPKEALLQVKDYYFKKKYLDRIADELQ
jgi:molecular chaperone HscB